MSWRETLPWRDFSVRHKQSSSSTEMWRRSPLVIVIASAAIVVAALYVAYRLVDPLPPRHLVISAGMTSSGYENFARQYARILARHGAVVAVKTKARPMANRISLGSTSMNASIKSTPNRFGGHSSNESMGGLVVAVIG
jgi:hypothetical protein